MLLIQAFDSFMSVLRFGLFRCNIMLRRHVANLPFNLLSKCHVTVIQRSRESRFIARFREFPESPQQVRQIGMQIGLAGKNRDQFPEPTFRLFQPAR